MLLDWNYLPFASNFNREWRKKQTLGDYTTINYMGEVWYNIPEGNIVNGQNTARRVSSNFSQGQGDVYSGYKRVSQVVANLF